MFVDYSGLDLAGDPCHQAWQTALDRIELDVLRGEMALANDTVLRVDEWDLPEDRGPIPPDLRQRAEEILDRQRQLLQGIAVKLGVTLRQQAFVDGVCRVSTRDGSRPVYLDVIA